MRRDLSKIVGAQIAWWQLGFIERRAVVRLSGQARPHPDPDVWADARHWAQQMLDAPWWWRLAKAVVVSGFAVLGVASTASLALEFDADYAVSIAVLAVAPLAVAWAWRQTRNARLIDRVQPVERSAGANPRWVPILLLVTAFLAVTMSVTVIVHTAHTSHEAVYGCALQPRNEQIRAWWIRHGGRSGYPGCPIEEAAIAANGQPFQRMTTGVVTITPTIDGLLVAPEVFEAWQANWQTLGDPIGPPLVDGPVVYVNFRGGHVSQAQGEQAIAVAGTSYEPKQYAGGPCTAHDRPCLVRADRSGADIHLAWHWGIADAFNVSWHRVGSGDHPGVEVAGYEYTVTGVDPGATYVINVQACDKRFLRSSICTPIANYTVSPETR